MSGQQQQQQRLPFHNINNNLKADALQGVSWNAPTIILVRPFLDQNVGAVARAMLNFGMAELRLVDPQCDFLSDDARARASGASVPVLERTRVFSTIAEATSDLTATFATTARLRDTTQVVVTPPEMARRITSISAAVAASSSPTNESFDKAESFVFNPSVGLLFGPERSGLTNEDLETVDALVQIPTNPNFASLNLAQAVNICGYAYHFSKDAPDVNVMIDRVPKTRDLDSTKGPSSRNKEGGEDGNGEHEDGEDLDHKEERARRDTQEVESISVESVLRVRDSSTEGLATKGEVNAFLTRLEESLEGSQKFFAKANGAKKAKIFGNLRALFHRQPISKREVQLLQGVVTALTSSQRE